MFPEPATDLDNQPHWSAAAAGELRYQYCMPCARFWYPPGPVCPRCQRARYSWRPVSGHGTVGCAVRYHKRYFPDAAMPYVVAQVDLPEGIRLSANVLGPDGTGLADVLPPPGTPVEVVFRDLGAGPVPAVLVTPAP